MQRRPHAEEWPLFAPRRLVCRSCGLSRSWAGRGIGVWAGTRGPAEDPYFRARLWLQRETRDGWLWAYDLRHLDLIRRHVDAGLRERAGRDANGPRHSLVARLPAWIKSAKHRDEVLRTVDRIRASVLTPG
ncbi:hypothetical protein ABZ636_22650 [Streptomyces sp. NPDC007251]|uniref:hypothetical protein n=1 Tax=Streptomyces sp. NPDC007251 TaxID=3154483 RepID=UPI0033BFF4D7